MNDAPLNLLIDLGSGYLKCGPPQLSEPVVIPAALKSPRVSHEHSVFSELDPGRGSWIFPLEDGMLPKDPTLVVQLAKKAIEQFSDLKANCARVEIMFLVFPLIPPEQVTEQCRTAQEALGCLHVDAAIQQVLTWGYWGRKSGLIVDVGYSVSFVTPIYRGFLLEEQVVPVVTGSFFVSAEIRKLLLYQAEIANSDQSNLYSQLAKDSNALSKIKQNFCQVRPHEVDGHFDEIARFQYQNSELSLGSIPWQATEVLFQPTLLRVGDKGLTDALIDVLEGVDTSIRAELASNIILAGGGSMFPGLQSRIQNDVQTQLPHLAVKVFDLEYPLYSSWLGAAKM